VYYKGNWNWSHFNAAGAVAGEPTPTTPPAVTPTPVAGQLGDVNDDGSISIVDALLVAQYYVGLTPLVFLVERADVNCDGSVNIVDALRIAQYYVGLVTSLSC
jgi:hypothetical protein